AEVANRVFAESLAHLQILFTLLSKVLALCIRATQSINIWSGFHPFLQPEWFGKLDGPRPDFFQMS
ncbi:MAG TPA: hypothetical protein VNO14_00245, partial [Blastocatellia bacterium]|nr:hypothetical protein [Blastocatellia bacterium]